MSACPILKMNEGENYNLQFSLTTNGTLLTENIVDWLAENKFSLKISLDGKKRINDMNRITTQGYSVHDKVTSNIPLIKRYEKKSGKYAQVTNVITRNNYIYYYESLCYLVEIGFKIIDTAIDFCVDWTNDELETIFDQIKKSYEFYITRIDEYGMERFHWSFIDELKNSVKEKKKFYSCGAGIVSLYVKINGDFYACPSCFDSRMKLGNIYTGYDIEKINFLKKVDTLNNKCNSCKLFSVCGAKGCLVLNLSSNNDMSIPNYALCSIEKFMYNFYQSKYSHTEVQHD